VNRYQLVAVLLSLVALMALPVSHAQDGRKTPVNADLKTLVQGNNEFAFDLYARLSQKSSNVVFSPYSISNALAMTYGGARRGNRAANGEGSALHPAGGALAWPPSPKSSASCRGRRRTGRTSSPSRNALWGQKGYPFLDAFLRLGRDHYRAGLQELDFRDQTEKARQTH